MNTNRYVLASIGAALFLYLYGWIVHGFILHDYWAANTAAGLMRPEDQVVMWAIALSCLLQGFALGYIFVKGREGTGVPEGLRFGLLIAWFIAGLYLLFYALQPWGFAPTLVSIVTDAIMYIGAGGVLAAIYKS